MIPCGVVAPCIAYDGRLAAFQIMDLGELARQNDVPVWDLR